MATTAPTPTGNDKLLRAIRKLSAPSDPQQPAIRRKLLEALTDAFTLEELKTLCWVLNIDGEALYASMDKVVFARELISYCERQHQLSQLVDAAREARPGIPLPTITRSARP